MAKSEIHVEDVGTVIERTCRDGSVALDVSGASAKEFIFQKPDGTTLTKSATFTTDGTDGKIQVVSESGDFDVAGAWRQQVSLTFPTGAWKSNIEDFQVYANLG